MNIKYIMEISNNTYIKTDENYIINETYIRWVYKYKECLRVCTKVDGCLRGKDGDDAFLICKENSPDSYKRLNAHFKK